MEFEFNKESIWFPDSSRIVCLFYVHWCAYIFFFFREYFNVLGIIIDFFCKTSVLKATKTMTKAIEKKRSIFINRRCKKKKIVHMRLFVLVLVWRQSSNRQYLWRHGRELHCASLPMKINLCISFWYKIFNMNIHTHVRRQLRSYSHRHVSKHTYRQTSRQSHLYTNPYTEEG